MSMYKIIFFGSSHHCLVTVGALFKDERYKLVAVVTQPPKPVGRKQIMTPTAVETWAVEHGIDVIKPVSWKKDSSVVERTRIVELAPVVGVLSNYGKILPQSVIDLFPKGIVNIHPSLLPKYRGPAPAVGAILHGDAVSGTSIMLLSAAMDAGPVLGTVEFPLDENETPETYYQKGFGLGTEKLLEILPLYLENKLDLQMQNESIATYTKMLSKEDGKIDWTKSAQEIDRQVRAFTPWPGTWTEVAVLASGKMELAKEMIMRTGATQTENNVQDQPISFKRLKINSGQTAQDHYIPEEVQLEGEQPRPWHQFLLKLA